MPIPIIIYVVSYIVIFVSMFIVSALDTNNFEREML